MRSFYVQKFPDKPIVYARILGEWSVDRDLPAYIEASLQALDQCDGPAYYISDLTRARLNLGEMLKDAQMAARGAQAIVHHRNMRELVTISGDGLPARGLNISSAHSIAISSYHCLEDALAAIYQKMDAPAALS